MKSLSLGLVYSTLTGVLYGDTGPFDAIISASGEGVSLVRRETIGGSDCVVLEARNRHGHYQVWIDPGRGYNVVKAILTKGLDDLCFGEPVKSHRFGPDRHGSGVVANARTMTKVVAKINNVVLEQQGRLWIRARSEHEKILTFSDGVANDLKIHCTVERLDVAADFDAMGAFKVKAPDGARAFAQGAPDIPYEWQDGAVVPSADHGHP